jgi:hypothetical protein
MAVQIDHIVLKGYMMTFIQKVVSYFVTKFP